MRMQESKTPRNGAVVPLREAAGGGISIRLVYPPFPSILRYQV